MAWENASQECAQDLGRYAFAGRARVLHRVAARLHSRRLDRALAAGAGPEATPVLAVRARSLTTLRRRRGIAASYRRIIDETRRAGFRSTARVPVCRSRVAASGEALGHLADALSEPGPIAPRGVAQALLLLRDGTGPLYNPGSAESLRVRGSGDISAAEFRCNRRTGGPLRVSAVPPLL